MQKADSAPGKARPQMELLAPAGDMEALRAAVQNGADAVYLGTGAFNARRHAGNFDGEALDEAVAYCHARGVKVHVTLNTLVRQDEFAQLTKAVEAVYASGADAVIVQDAGVVQALRSMAPELQRHASTQMAAHNPQGVAFLRDRGFHRVVLARELTFEEMAACAREGIEVEVFAHGALCVACSGQCLMSSLVGGRSGNRGLCAQPCRLPWRLDGREGFLLSTRDLCAIDDLPRLRDAGVASLKIEGRLKRAEYVAVTVAAYRRALDALQAGTAFDTEEARRELMQMFNRGAFTRGYGPGVRESELMYPLRPNHMGVTVGACRADGAVALDAAVLPADALVLRRGDGDIPVKLSGGAGERVRCPQAKKGDRLFRLVSRRQMDAARQSFEGEHRAVAVAARATLRVGRPAALWVSDGEHAAEAAGDVIQAATGRGLDPERVRSQLKKTGGTAYTVSDVALDADDNAFCPASLLNALRREALAALQAERLRSARPKPGGFAMPVPEGRSGGQPRLIAQSGSPARLAAALSEGADEVVFAPEDLRPEALGALDLGSLAARAPLGLALPAVMTGEALEAVNAWALDHADWFSEVVLSNVGQLGLDWPGRRVGDYLLNIANDAAVCRLEALGLREYTPSVELNTGQIGAMGGAKQILVWGRLPLMHLRHCPLRAASGAKGLHRDCRHCDGCPAQAALNGKTLIDRKGAVFPLKRLAMPGGCVVQVLNSVPLMPLKRLKRLPEASGWRLLLEEGEPTEAIVRVCRAALDGGDCKALPEWQTVEALNTTTGHYCRGVE